MTVSHFQAEKVSSMGYALTDMHK